MTPTELWDIYYHAMKGWLPGRTDKQVREAVDRLMDVSGKVLIETAKSRYFISGIDPAMPGEDYTIINGKRQGAARKGVCHDP